MYIKPVFGKWYNEKTDDIHITPAIVCGDASDGEIKAFGIALVWIRFTVGLAFFWKSTQQAH